jgi:hypothetical protein
LFDHDAPILCVGADDQRVSRHSRADVGSVRAQR